MNLHKRHLPFGVAAGLALLAAGGLTQTSGAPAAPPASPPASAAKPSAAKEAPRTMVIVGEDIDHNDTTGEGSAKNVVVTYPEGAVISAQEWTWNDHKKVAHALGDLHMTDDQMDATADEAEVFYAKSKRLLVLTGNIHITIKPKPAEGAGTETKGKAPTGAGASAPHSAPVVVTKGKATVEPTVSPDDTSEPQARQYPIDVTCDKVEYSYARDVRHAVLTGNFVAVQKVEDATRTVHAKFADWFGVDEKIVLHAPVAFEDTRGRKGETDQDAVISAKQGDEGIQMQKGKIEIPIEEGEETPSGKPAGPAKPASPSQPAAPPSPKPGATPGPLAGR